MQRRLLVITFNRVIPLEERIEFIGRRVGEEEPDPLLAWAVAGAARLILTCPLKSGPGLMLGLAVFEEAGDGKAASHSRGDYRQVA